MKYFFLSLFLLAYISATAQNPVILKIVGSTVLQPGSTDQEGWKNNEWNGMFFYQGTGSPTKLCVSDGTAAGTIYLADIGSGNIVASIPAQDFIYIITNRVVSFSPFTFESEIWKSDGTAAGTSLVKTMPQIVSSSISNVWTSDRDAKKNFSVNGNTMFFGGYDAANGVELWKTDGTPAGTMMVKDINAGSAGSTPAAFCKLNNEIFFTCIQSGSARKLWKTDGTDAGTVQIAVAEPFFIVDNAVGIVNNKMIFYAHNTVDGFEPYVSDGTAAGTFMLANINPSGNSWITQSQNAHLRFNNNYCFFVASNGTARALWRTDGTSAGTIQLTTNTQNASSNVSGGSYTETDNNGIWMIEYNTSGSGNNEKLYRSNGTPQGTYLATSGLSFGQYLKSYNGALWMQSRDIGSAANAEPWRCGGNQQTTGKAFDLAFLGGNFSYSSNPFGYFTKQGKLYFFATPINGTMNLYQYTGDFTFNGSVTGGRWADSANWNGMMPPGITDTVFVNSGTPNALNINGANAFAGVLNIGNNATVNITNTADSIFVNTRLVNGTNSNFTGNGVLAFKSITNDTIQITNAFTANNVTVLSNTNLLNGTGTINGNMNLTNGRFFLNNNNLVITGNTAIVTANSNAYIATNGTGSLQVQNIGVGARTGVVNFPVGTLTAYNPAGIINAGASDAFSVRVISNSYASYSGEIPGTQQYTSGAVNNTWFINEANNGGSDASVSLQWNALQELPGFNRTQSFLGHFTGGSWDYGNAVAATGADPYSITRTNITSFSPFAVLNSGAVVPLQFIGFTAQKCGSNQVCLRWQTANEQQVSHFEIERSMDGIGFSTIGRMNANNQQQNIYTASDDITSLRTSRKIYYRIKEVDRDNRTKLSNVNLVRVDGNTLTVYPTLVNRTFNVQHDAGEPMRLQLLAADGRLVLQQNIVTGTNMISAGKLAAGVYHYRLTGSDGLVNSTGKIIKL